MSLRNFVKKEARTLPVFLLVDTSGSMIGQKIDTVNTALREMIAALSNVETPVAKIQVSIITFGTDVKVIQPLTDVKNISFNSLTANGRTPMGQAINIVTDLIEDRSKVTSRDYTPTIILISDGKPTDIPREVINHLNDINSYLNWDPISKLHSNPRSMKAQRLALGIGEDAQYEMLKAFINKGNIPVIKAQDSQTIAKFFKWVTMTVSVRSLSSDPNSLIEAPMDDIFEISELYR